MRLNVIRRSFLGMLSAVLLVSLGTIGMAEMEPPSNPFMPVYQPLYEKISKLTKGVLTTDPKMEELSVMWVETANHEYAIVRYCMVTSEGSCPVSIYRDEITDEHFFGSVVVSAFSFYWDTDLKLCGDCTSARPLVFKPQKDIYNGCSVTLVFTDRGFLQHFGC